jgi:hypothetical protein
MTEPTETEPKTCPNCRLTVCSPQRRTEGIFWRLHLCKTDLTLMRGGSIVRGRCIHCGRLQTHKLPFRDEVLTEVES